MTLCLIWTYCPSFRALHRRSPADLTSTVRLPEPRGRTYGELDVLFERRVPARLFAKTQVEDLKTLSRVMSRAHSPGAFKEETSFRSL